MIIKYTIEPTSEVTFENFPGMPEQMSIDGAEISFDRDENQTLQRVNVSFSGLPMKWEREDLIALSYPETRDQVFRIIKYLVDRIQMQVKNKSFGLSRFNDIITRVSPETEEEKDDWGKYRKRIMKSLEMPYSILGAVDLSNYESNYRHSQAFSNFTDALNTDNPITKFERFYKVIETFFTTHGSTLDSDISAFMQNFDVAFTANDFQRLRDMRNRCIHPQHRRGHIASNDLELTNDLAIHTKELEKIAELLLNEI